MKFDASRGHRPDRKRQQDYRRVLLQQGRLLLDSDLAALVDAQDTLLRGLSRDLGCRAGSPNLGFLVTSGPLLAQFQEPPPISETAAPFVAWRDYQAKFHERFPSLYLGGMAGAGSVKFPLRQTLTRAATPQVRVWARAGANPANLSLELDGVAVPGGLTVTDPTGFVAYTFTVPNGLSQYSVLSIGIGSGLEAWIGLIEGLEPAGAAPHFWATGGRYHIDGLPVSLPADGQYPGLSFPLDASLEAGPAPSSGTRLVAFLEGWEQHITRVEDPGILEQALGGLLDTTTRTRAVGQVKLALVSGAVPTRAQVFQAFASPAWGGGRLTVTTAAASASTDPCAIPEAAGYTGSENRLYRFEVHTGGALGTALLKWSRANASELYPVSAVTNSGSRLTLAAGATLDDADLIEFLTGIEDVGDQQQATLSVSAFVPPVRAVGQLFRVQAVAGSSTIAPQFDLRDPETSAPAALAAAVPEDASTTMKVRVWHGLVRSDLPEAGETLFKAPIEDGIEIGLSNHSFTAGETWQYEARRQQENANGPWDDRPHGPERLFAPLAHLRFISDKAPLDLIEWYDKQFSPLCQLSADDIAYDGESAGTTADTVQEALDELFSCCDHQEGGCCHASLSPGKPGEDDALALQSLIAELPSGTVICLREGEFHFGHPVLVEGKRITLQGCPRAQIKHAGGDLELFVVGAQGCLELRDLSLYAEGDVRTLITLGEEDARLECYGCQLLLGGADLESHPDAAAIRQEGAKLAVPDLMDPEYPHWEEDPASVQPQTGSAPSLRLERTVVVAPASVVVIALGSLELSDVALYALGYGLVAREVRKARVGGLEVQTGIPSGALSELAGAFYLQDRLQVNAILESLAADAAGGLTFYGTALYATRLFDTGIERSQIRADVGLWAGLARDLRLEANRSACGRTALRFDNAVSCQLVGEVVSALEFCLHVPLAGLDVSVSGGNLTGKAAVVLAADYGDGGVPPSRRIQGFSLLGNVLRVGWAGILAGDYGSSEAVVSLSSLHIHGNRIEGEDREGDGSEGYVTGIRLIAPPPLGRTTKGGTGPVSDASIQDNDLRAVSLGLEAYGFSLEASDNRISLAVGDETQAIALYACTQTALRDNCVDFPDDASSAYAGGIYVEQGSWITLSGNRLQATVPTRPLVAMGSMLALILSGNQWSPGTLRAEGIQGLIVRNELHVYGGFYARACEFGIFAQNLIGQDEEAPGLILEDAVGKWQIEGNQVDGALRLLPLLTENRCEGQSSTGSYAAPTREAAYRALEREGLLARSDIRLEASRGFDTLRRSGGSSSAGRGVPATSSSRPSQPMATRDRAARSAADLAAERAPRAPSLSGQLLSPELERVMQKADKALYDIQKELLREFNEPLPLVNEALYEVEVQAQVEGNLAEEVQVGYLNPGYKPATNYPAPTDLLTRYPCSYSVVQVIGNQARQRLIVNRYPRSVVVHNIAGEVVDSGLTYEAIQGPNLDV